MRIRKVLLPVMLILACGGSAFSRGIFEKPVKLAGNVIPHPAAASDFTLTDQNGSPFHMADTRGKVVVITFIYASCTDLCPFITLKLKSAREHLGKDADKAVFVAVTTDPARDTQGVIRAYSEAAGLTREWHFVTGPLSAVKDVWFNYGIGVSVAKEHAHHTAMTGSMMNDPEPVQGLTPAEADLARTIAERFGGGYDVSHSAPFWFIDKRGMIRASMDAEALPAEIADNIRELMRS
jgi:cytochrome oxidase Cu insertion factor (SCO1/SenC/PrrC family)